MGEGASADNVPSVARGISDQLKAANELLLEIFDRTDGVTGEDDNMDRLSGWLYDELVKLGFQPYTADPSYLRTPPIPEAEA